MAAPFDPNLVQFLAKAEAQEGTAEVLAAADAKIQIDEDYSIDPVIPYFQRNVGKADTGDFPGTAGGIATCTLGVKIKCIPSGTAGTAPALGLLLQAGGMSVTNVPATSDTYKPSTTYQSITAAINQNGWRTRIFGAKTKSMEWHFPNGGPIDMDAEIEGIYEEPSAVAVVTPTFESSLPIVMKSLNAYTFNGVALKIRDFTLRYENRTQARPLATSAAAGHSIKASPANPQITGTITPEIEDAATHNFFSLLTAGTTFALSMIVNAAGAGKILTVSAPAVQYMGLKPEKGDAVAMVTAELLFCRSTGNDAISIIWT